MSRMSVEDTIRAQLKYRKNTHIMLVEGISKLWTHKVKTCQSSVFHISGHKWKMIVHPAGKDGRSDYLSFHLRIKDKKSLGFAGEVKCTLKLIVVAQTGPDMCHSNEWPVVCYNAKQAIHGKDDFIPHMVLKERYLVNDKMVFGVEVTNVRSNCAATAIPRTVGTLERLKLIDVPRNNSRFTWKITKFSSFNGEVHASNEFTIGPRKWKIGMFPKGDDGDLKGKYLSLFLKASDSMTNGPEAKTLAVYKLRLLNQLHCNHRESETNRWFNYGRRARSSWTASKYMALETLNDPSKGFLVDDEIYIGVEFLLISTTEYL